MRAKLVGRGTAAGGGGTPPSVLCAATSPLLRNGEEQGGLMRHFAVVGSGPAGFYTPEALQKAYESPARLDIIDRHAVPFRLLLVAGAPHHPLLQAVGQPL